MKAIGIPSALLVLLPLSVGNHTTYGGGDFSGGGGYSGGGLSGLGGFFFLGNLGGGGVGTAIVIVAIVLLAFFLQSRHKGAARPFNGYQGAPVRPAAQNDEIARRIGEHDPGFSTERFLSYSEQVFVQLQQAWTERSWKKVRPLESESLFNLHKAQLDEFIRNGQINRMENVCVNESFLCDYAQEEKYEFLTVFMNTRYNDYIVEESTGKVIKGDPNRTYQVQYRLKFMRSVGVQTGEHSNETTTRCPNCGAPVDVSETGECSYCGTVITTGEHGWVLCNMDDVGQQ